MKVNRVHVLGSVTKILMHHFFVVLMGMAGLIITGSVLVGDICTKKITLVNLLMLAIILYYIKGTFDSSFLEIFRILSDTIWMRLNTNEAVYLKCFETETDLLFMKANKLRVNIAGQTRHIISRKPIVYKENSLIRIAYTSKSNILVKTELIEERDNGKKASRRQKR